MAEWQLGRVMDAHHIGRITEKATGQGSHHWAVRDSAHDVWWLAFIQCFSESIWGLKNEQENIQDSRWGVSK